MSRLALTDGNNMVGLTDGLSEFPRIDFRVYPMIEFRVTEKDKVVDSDDALDAATADTHRQLTGEAVIELYAITLQL